VTDADRALRWRMAVSYWYARMIAAVRAGEQFNEPKPSLEDFL
jgi:hypothetical protein